jgi:hypothetical protein
MTVRSRVVALTGSVVGAGGLALALAVSTAAPAAANSCILIPSGLVCQTQISTQTSTPVNSVSSSAGNFAFVGGILIVNGHIVP